MIKNPGGALIPATDIDSESMKKFRNGEFYEIDIKLGRNPQFLKKAMCFFKFCQDNYDSTKVQSVSSGRIASRRIVPKWEYCGGRRVPWRRYYLKVFEKINYLGLHRYIEC